MGVFIAFALFLVFRYGVFDVVFVFVYIGVTVVAQLLISFHVIGFCFGFWFNSGASLWSQFQEAIDVESREGYSS